jgi:ketosteroid isomerase-like protein
MIYAAATIATGRVISTAPVAAAESSCQILDEISLYFVNQTGLTNQLSKGILMSDRNLAVVTQIFERFSAGDMPGLLSFQSDEIVWDYRSENFTEGMDNPLNNLWKGKTGITQFLNTLLTTQEVIEFEPRDFFANEDQVVAIGHSHWKVIETGKEWASDFAMVFTLKEGLVTHWRPIFDYTAERIAYQS